MKTLEKNVIINRDVREVYEYWDDLENLPQFMNHLKSVEKLGKGVWRWTVEAGRREIQWETKITPDSKNKIIHWQSLDPEAKHTGSISFEKAPDGIGTKLTLSASGRFQNFFGKEPEKEIEKELLHFKQLLETGDIARIIHQELKKSA